MKHLQLEYSRTFNLGQYESERVGLTIELDPAEDVDEVFRTVKARVFRLHEGGKLLEESRKVVESEKTLEDVKEALPEDIRSLLSFELEGNWLLVKPREFLGSDNFTKIASKARELGGEYVSAGKDSHFKIPLKKSAKDPD